MKELDSKIEKLDEILKDSKNLNFNGKTGGYTYYNIEMAILSPLISEYKKQKEEIERLNNIINEFDKWLLGEKMMFYKSSDDERLIRYGETKNKWLELKGVDKNC